MIIKPNVAEGIHTLTSFKRDSGPILERMKSRQEPVVLTVNGKAEAVLLDPAAFEELLEQLDVVKAVRSSMASFDRGEGVSAKKAFQQMRKKYSIPQSRL